MVIIYLQSSVILDHIVFDQQPQQSMVIPNAVILVYLLMFTVL